MPLPFKLEDVRLISIQGDTIQFVLPNGFVEVQVDSRKCPIDAAAQTATPSRIDAKHIFFEDGIYGI